MCAHARAVMQETQAGCCENVAGPEQLAAEVSEADASVSSLIPPCAAGSLAPADGRIPPAEQPSLDDAVEAATGATGTPADRTSDSSGRTADDTASPAMPIPPPAGAIPNSGHGEQGSSRPGAGRPPRKLPRFLQRAAYTAMDSNHMSTSKLCRWAATHCQLSSIRGPWAINCIGCVALNLPHFNRATLILHQPNTKRQLEMRGSTADVCLRRNLSLDRGACVIRGSVASGCWTAVACLLLRHR